MTTSELSRRLPPAPDEIREYLRALAASHPAHAPVVRALAGLLATRAELAVALAPGIAVVSPDADRAAFAAGRPLLPYARLPLPPGAGKRLLQGLADPARKAFPVLGAALTALEEAFSSGRLRLSARLRAHLAREAVPTAAELDAVGSSPEAAAMLLGQMAKTLAEAAGLAFAKGTAGFDGWTRGYCPVCGSMPELSFLDGKEGVRRLCCGRCGSVWRFTRVACPVCELSDQNKIELIYLEDAPLERAEACHACRRYVLSVDPRQRSGPFHPSLEPLALLHLDVILQERGFTPATAEPPVTA